MKNIISIIVIIISLASFALVVKPNYDEIKNMKSVDSELDGVLDNARRLQSTRDSLLEKRKNLNSDDVRRLEKLIPPSADNVKLILEFEQMAGRHNLSIQAASAAKDEAEDGDENANATGNQGFDVDTKDYGIVTLDFTLEGGYADFISFLEELEKNLRITDLRTLNIAPPVDGQGLYQYDISVETYWLKENIF